MNYQTTIAVFIASGLSIAASARADFDARPYLSNNQILTGGHDDENDIDTANQRVFEYDLGDVPADPYNIGDPGFNTNGASSFLPTSELDYRGLAIRGGTYIQYWNGSGGPSFGPDPAGVTINLARTPNAYISYASNGVSYTGGTPLEIGTFASTNGALHIHLGSEFFENGTQTTGSVPTGEYLISYRLENPGTGVLASDPLYIVYNNGLSDAQTEAAADYVIATDVPEPTALASLALTSTALFSRRKK